MKSADHSGISKKNPLSGSLIYFRSLECFGDSLDGDIVENSFDVKEDAEIWKKVSFISYVPFDFVGDFVQGYFSGATLSETDLPFVQVSEDVEVVLYVPQQYFLLEFE